MNNTGNRRGRGGGRGRRNYGRGGGGRSRGRGGGNRGHKDGGRQWHEKGKFQNNNRKPQNYFFEKHLPKFEINGFLERGAGVQGDYTSCYLLISVAADNQPSHNHSMA